jgi:hypothetical protein
MPYYARREVFATVGSDTTSKPYNIEGFDTLTVQVVGASNATVQVSNDEGRQASITNWSDLTTLTEGMHQLPVGSAWLRITRSSNTLAATVSGLRDRA